MSDRERLTVRRRAFVQGLLASAAWVAAGCAPRPIGPPSRAAGAHGPNPGGQVNISAIQPDEDVFAYVARIKGTQDHAYYKAVIGAANERKEGDEALGLAAEDEASRARARALLSRTKIGDLVDHPMAMDQVYAFVLATTDPAALAELRPMTLGALKRLLLTRPEAEIKRLMIGLPSDIIGMVVKLMSDDELTRVGQTVFNPLPGSNVGAKGYLGARIQPNSPTDDPTDIQWQVFNGFAFAVGDVVLGNNPVSSEVESVLGVELALAEVLQAFGLTDVLPHCCLSHVDVQAAVEAKHPGATALWFQSLGSTDAANATFDVTVEKLKRHAATRRGKFGMYFETGQGADATNGHGDGFDMVIHESRKYGFARALRAVVAEAQAKAGAPVAPWVHVNDVAGFIGPECFRTKEQLVRCCLEDIVMGKLHGLPIGLDVCSTLHMDVSLDDLDWCIDRIMPANPAYLMALPTKNDPMLSYLTTAFQDHVRIRERFGYKVDDRMWAFFQRLGVIDASGKPTEHFGDVRYVYAKFRKAKGDPRTVEQIREAPETRQTLVELKKRGVFIADGHGARPFDLNPELDRHIRFLYADGKESIFAELPAAFEKTVPDAVRVWTRSRDRSDYILHAPTGERLHDAALPALRRLRDAHAGKFDVQLMLSDGLNAHALTDPGHLEPYLTAVRARLTQAGFRVAPEHLICTSGRVRAGYHAGEVLFGGLADQGSHRALLHVIGERPGSEHHSFSVYVTAPKVETWAKPGKVDHDITRVVAGIADTALAPTDAAALTVSLLKRLVLG